MKRDDGNAPIFYLKMKSYAEDGKESNIGSAMSEIV